MTRFQKLAVATAASTLALITVGAIVRASGAGLGCPDWPRCHGRWIPPLQADALIEYSHRLTASVVGALVLALAVYAWVRFRSFGGIFWPAFGSLLVVLFQGALGRLVVERELESGLVALHFATSLVLLGLVVLAAGGSFMPRGGRMDRRAAEALVMAAALFALAMIGAFVTQWSAALAFADWPLMGGRLLPSLGGPTQVVHFLHRLAALGVGAVLVRLAVTVMREPRDAVLVRLAHTALALWIVQVLVGGANVFTRSASWAVAAHVLLGALLWATAVTLALAAYRRAPRAEEALPPRIGDRGAARTVRAYFLLTKPRVIELLLITTVPAMIVAAGGWPPPSLVLATLLGGSLAAGAANAINCYLDRDIDERMERTADRPLPARRVEPANALRFGLVLSGVSFGWLAVAVNLLAAVLAMSAILFYVFVYTIWLKRSTPSNIVVGGAAGAVPVLVGWAAVTGSLDVAPLVLFAVVFYWTPPHFWALALRYSSDYAAAGVPMLPVVRGVSHTTRQMVLYSIVLFAVALLLYPLGHMGVLYLGVAVLLGALFVEQAVRLHRNPTPRQAMSLFRFSIAYLTILFTAVAADRLVHAGRAASLDGPALVAGLALFLLFEGAILAAVLKHRRGAGGTPLPEGTGLLAEIIRTILPTVAAGLMLVLSRPPGVWT